MKIKLMRFVDYYAGVPLCFLFSAVHFISMPLFFRKKYNIIPKKILIIKLSEMGSIILSYPLLNGIKFKYPEAKLFFLVFTKNKPAVEILDVMLKKNILTIRDSNFLVFIIDAAKVLRKIRRENIDIVFDLELFSRFTSILSYLSGAPKKAGFCRYFTEGLYRGNFLTHKIQYNPNLHISKSFLSMLQGAEHNVKMIPTQAEKIEDNKISLPRFVSSEEIKRSVWNKLKQINPVISERSRLVLINPGEGNIPLREWPLGNFNVLIDKILKDSTNYVIIIGTKGASKNAEFLCKSANNRCLNLAGKTNIEEVLSLCNTAALLVATDSGLAHIASLAPIKKIILFGPESPKIYSPLGENVHTLYSDLPCSPCFSAFNHRQSACKDNKCLKVIKPEDVFELINVYLR